MAGELGYSSSNSSASRELPGHGPRPTKSSRQFAQSRAARADADSSRRPSRKDSQPTRYGPRSSRQQNEIPPGSERSPSRASIRSHGAKRPSSSKPKSSHPRRSSASRKASPRPAAAPASTPTIAIDAQKAEATAGGLVAKAPSPNRLDVLMRSWSDWSNVYNPGIESTSQQILRTREVFSEKGGLKNPLALLALASTAYIFLTNTLLPATKVLRLSNNKMTELITLLIAFTDKMISTSRQFQNTRVSRNLGLY